MKKDKLEWKLNPRFLVEEVRGMGCVDGRESDGLMILEVCFLYLFICIHIDTYNVTIKYDTIQNEPQRSYAKLFNRRHIYKVI